MSDIRMRGFVDDVLEGKTGPYGLKVAEPHRRKDGDSWVTDARTFHRVTAGYQVAIQWHRFTKGDRVSVVGKQVTEHWRDRDGNDRYTLVVKADVVELDAPAPESDEAPIEGGWDVNDTSTPF